MFLSNLYFYFDELSWKIRINIIIILLFFKPNHKKIFQDLKNHGVAVVNGYFSNEDISNILSLCEEEINKLEKNQDLKEILEVDNLVLNNGVRVEKYYNTIKIKNIGNSNLNLKKFAKKDFILNLLISFYQFKINLSPYLLYSYTHDGNTNFLAAKSHYKDKMIAGEFHADSYKHYIKAYIPLKDVDEENGPLTIFKSSMYDKKIQASLNNIYLVEKGILNIRNPHVIENESIEGGRFEKFVANNKKCDLVIFDTRNIHYASVLKKGERKILWYYY